MLIPRPFGLRSKEGVVGDVLMEMGGDVVISRRPGRPGDALIERSPGGPV